MSGSDFVEMFVELDSRSAWIYLRKDVKFKLCIFIDELDGGSSSRSGLGSGNDEREQTLNQLLVEMDGFDATDGIIIIASTNRPDVLDPALLRPGRFDRQIHVPLPDVSGRLEILQIHIQKVNVIEAVDLQVIAKGTPGFSGADLKTGE